MLFCPKIHYMFMINAVLSQNFVVPIYALFPPIFLCSKVDHRQFVRFLDVWQYLRRWLADVLSGRHLVLRHFVLRKMQKVDKSLQRSPKSAKGCHKLPKVSLRIPQNQNSLKMPKKTSDYLRIHQNSLRMPQNASECFRIHQNISEYLRIRQNTSK